MLYPFRSGTLLSDVHGAQHRLFHRRQPGGVRVAAAALLDKARGRWGDDTPGERILRLGS